MLNANKIHVKKEFFNPSENNNKEKKNSSN